MLREESAQASTDRGLDASLRAIAVTGLVATRNCAWWQLLPSWLDPSVC